MWRKLSILWAALSLLVAASVVNGVQPFQTELPVEKAAAATEDQQPQHELKGFQLLPQQHGQVSLRVLLPAMPIWSVFTDEAREIEVPRSSMPDALILVKQLLLTHIIPSLAP